MPDTDSDSIAANLAAVRARLDGAARAAGRDPATVRLIAISKTFSADAVRAAYLAGHRDFGENKVQEALQKIEQTSDLAIDWHLVGHLQSNKARKAGARFDLVHSVDQAAIAARLDEGAAAAGRSIELLAQVDLAREPSKHGAPVDQLPGLLQSASSLRAARFVGLMLLPPAVDDPELARPFFRAIRTLRDELVTRGVDRSMLGELSMGMSHDFEVAVEEGATLIRVGTAIFGGRHYG